MINANSSIPLSEQGGLPSDVLAVLQESPHIPAEINQQAEDIVNGKRICFAQEQTPFGVFPTKTTEK
jgi:hypothetical protein